MPQIHPDLPNPRYQLHDLVTGERYSVTYGDPILTSVTSGVRKCAMDAMPDNNVNRGNFLRGGYGSSSNMRDPMLSRRPGSIGRLPTKSHRECVSVTCPRKILLSNTTSP